MAAYIPFGSAVNEIQNPKDDDFDPTETNNSYFVGENDDEEDELSIAFRLIFIVVAFGFALVVLRYACIFFIDTVILCQRPRASNVKHALSRCCPRWFPQTNTESDPQSNDGTNSNSNDDENDEDEQEEYEYFDRDVELGSRTTGTAQLLQVLTPMQRKLLFSSVLESKTVTEQDIQAWSSSQTIKPEETGGEDADGLSSRADTAASGYLCPICIQDIRVGDKVCHSKLDACKQHLFHFDCIVDWLNTGSTLCPCCRRVILTKAMLEDALEH